jgi:hypothetical protein
MYSLNTFSPKNHGEAVNLSTWFQEVSVHNSPGYRKLRLTYFIIYLDALKFNFNNLHGYTVHQWYQTLYCPTNAHNVNNVELLKHFKIKEVAPKCFGLQENHHQGATTSI